jgi:hypothetical protein
LSSQTVGVRFCFIRTDRICSELLEHGKLPVRMTDRIFLFSETLHRHIQRKQYENLWKLKPQISWQNMEVPNTAQNLAVSAISRHCAAVMLSKFSTRLKLILPVLHIAEGNILSYRRGALNMDNLSLLY